MSHETNRSDIAVEPSPRERLGSAFEQGKIVRISIDPATLLARCLAHDVQVSKFLEGAACCREGGVQSAGDGLDGDDRSSLHEFVNAKRRRCGSAEGCNLHSTRQINETDSQAMMAHVVSLARLRAAEQQKCSIRFLHPRDDDNPDALPKDAARSGEALKSLSEPRCRTYQGRAIDDASPINSSARADLTVNADRLLSRGGAWISRCLCSHSDHAMMDCLAPQRAVYLFL
jgi:hypothetical protein